MTAPQLLDGLLLNSAGSTLCGLHRAVTSVDLADPRRTTMEGWTQRLKSASAGIRAQATDAARRIKEEVSAQLCFQCIFDPFSYISHITDMNLDARNNCVCSGLCAARKYV